MLAVYVHFGLRGNSGHYKVYIKINEKWFEFNDEIVQETNWEMIKKYSFGGKIKDLILDNRNFTIKYRRKEAIGHAYRLVYIRKQEKNMIMNNDG